MRKSGSRRLTTKTRERHVLGRGRNIAAGRKALELAEISLKKQSPSRCFACCAFPGKAGYLALSVPGHPSGSVVRSRSRAEKKLPLAQEPLPGSFCLQSVIVALFSEKPGLRDALRSSLIHNSIGSEYCPSRLNMFICTLSS
jgi:hypothetical protein